MRELHNITLTEEREIAPGLFTARDNLGMLRLHDGAIYRGYASTWGSRFQMSAWSAAKAGQRRIVTRRMYRTLAGAERALLRKGLEIHAEA